MHALELTENETQFVKKLRKISPQRQISLVQMIDQFLEPEGCQVKCLSRK